MQGSGPYLIDVDMASFDPMEISIMPKRNHEVDSGLRKS
jgi:hypothetical protein